MFAGPDRARWLDECAPLAAIDDQPGIAGDAFSAFKQPAHRRQMCGQEPVVQVEERDEPATGEIDAGIACSSAAPVVLSHEADARIRVAVDHGFRVVPRTVVDNDDLEILVRLIENGLHRDGKDARAVIDRYDDGEEWRRRRIHDGAPETKARSRRDRRSMASISTNATQAGPSPSRKSNSRKLWRTTNTKIVNNSDINSICAEFPCQNVSAGEITSAHIASAKPTPPMVTNNCR